MCSYIKWRVPLADLDYDQEEENAVLNVLRRGWLTMGSVTQEFEKQFGEYLGVKYAIAVSNATVALHLACLGLGIGPGDEVIIPSLTFVATASAVLYSGAHPCFADIGESYELNISPEEIEKKITSRTKAIIVVHYAGYPCRMRAISKIASNYGLALIEDAAHAPGASLGGKSLGTWGDIGCFSFFSNKNLSTGEGGMLVTDRDDVAQKVRILRSHGMTSMTWDRHRGHAYSYDVVELGYNYRIDEIRSALGLAQLAKLTRNNARRKTITEVYWDELSELQEYGLRLPFRELSGDPAYHIFPIILPKTIDRSNFMERLRISGIQTSIHYPPIHLFKYYREMYPNVFLPKTESASKREVTLPLYPTMSPDSIELVTTEVKNLIKSN